VSVVLVAAVLAAGAVGALLRYGATRLARPRSAGIPLAVLVVNVVGSLVAGVAAASPIGEDLRLVVITGFAGGLTTFSTLSVETVQLVLDRRTGVAVASIVANLLMGAGAAALGWWLGGLLA
jgi:CrcB protein